MIVSLFPAWYYVRVLCDHKRKLRSELETGYFNQFDNFRFTTNVIFFRYMRRISFYASTSISSITGLTCAFKSVGCDV